MTDKIVSCPLYPNFLLFLCRFLLEALTKLAFYAKHPKILTSCSFLYYTTLKRRQDVTIIRPGKVIMQKKLLTLFIGFAAIPIVVIYIIFSQIFHANIEQNIKNVYTTNITNVSKIAENYFNESIDLTMYPLIEPNLIAFYTTSSDSDEFSAVFASANTILSSSPYIFGGIRSTTLMRKDQVSLTVSNNHSYNSEITSDEQAFVDALDGKAYWDIHPVKDRYAVSITRLIKSKPNLSQSLGYIKTSTSLQELSEALKKAGLDKDFSYIITTGDLFPLLSTNADESYFQILKELGADQLISLSQAHEQTIKAGKYFVSAAPIKETPFYMFSVIKPDTLMESSALRTIVLPVAVITFVFFLLLGILFSRHITNPIITLGNKMASISTGDFTVRADMDGTDEIAQLASQFNYMSERLEYLYHKVYQGEIELNKAQLIALQSQINPHFLYNTIDTIYWMSKMGHTQLVSKIASNMSQLLRLTITPNPQNQIPLEKELEHLNCYMEIQNIRYGDCVKFSLEYEQEYNHLQVLKLLLQPLVENALIHGLKQQEQEEIHVRIFTKDNCLFYEIRNNGTPISIPYINRLLSCTDDTSHGFAIRNIDKRLKLQYGDNFGLKYGIDNGFSYFIVCQPIADL